MKFTVDSGFSPASTAHISGFDKDHTMIASEIGIFLVVLHNGLGVSDLSHNLVSVGVGCVNGYKFLFSEKVVTMFEENDLLFSSSFIEAKLINNLFYFDISTEPIQRNDNTLHDHLALLATIIPENRISVHRLNNDSLHMTRH